MDKFFYQSVIFDCIVDNHLHGGNGLRELQFLLEAYGIVLLQIDAF